MKNNNILPSGFYDIIENDAQIYYQSKSKIMDIFNQYGYDFIKTSLIENEHISDYEQKSLRINNINGDNLIFRNDITAQIARLYNSYLCKKIKPIRLCYAGDIININNDIFSDNQLTQLGIELIGSEDINHNIEVISIIFKALSELIDLDDLLIELYLKNFHKIIDIINIDNNNIFTQNDIDNIKLSLKNKNITVIKRIFDKITNKNSNYYDIISKLLFAKDIDTIYELLTKLNIDSKYYHIYNPLESLNKIKEILHKFTHINYHINIFSDDIDDKKYYDDLMFKIFKNNFPREIAKGGGYEITVNNDKEQIYSFGATIYINYLRKIITKNITDKNNIKKILIPYDIDNNIINKLQNDGYITIFYNNCNQEYVQKFAKYYNIKYIYDGKINKININNN